MLKRYILFLLIAGGLVAASAQPCTTYTATDNPQLIPDDGGTSGMTISNVNIPQSGTIGGSVTFDQVQIDLDHTFDGDLDITLISPANTPLLLSSGNGSSGNDYENTIFRDDASMSITAGTAPFNGTFLPQGGSFASTFGGESINGNWSLKIVDDLVGDNGTLYTFSITVCDLCPGDVTPPVARCRDHTVSLDANGQASILPGDIDNGSYDDCYLESLVLSRSSFNCDDVRPALRRRPSIVLVTLTATDALGNSSQCVSRVEVKDLTPPSMNCRNIVVQLPLENRYNLQPSEVDNGSFDACGLKLTLSKQTFDCSDLGNNTIQLTGTDPSGNSSTCLANVDIQPGASSCVNARATTATPSLHSEAVRMLLFPNPTAGELNLWLPTTRHSSRLTIQDQLGRTVFTRLVDAEQAQLQLQLSPERFPPGLYFVHWQATGASPLVERLLVID